MNIETVFQYNRRELLYVLRVSRRLWARRRYAASGWLIALAIIAPVSLVVREGIGGLGVALALVTELRLRRAARVFAKREQKAPRTYTVTEDAFSTRSGAVTRSLEWDKMHSVRRKGDWWYLHVTKRKRLLLPVRAFDDDQRGQFEELLARRGWGTLTGS